MFRFGRPVAVDTMLKRLASLKWLFDARLVKTFMGICIFQSLEALIIAP